MSDSSVKPSADPNAPARRAPKRRPRNREEDPVPVVSGRYMVAAVLIGATAMVPFSPLGRVLEPRERAHKISEWTPGSVRDVRITLVTSDYLNLACASDAVLEGAHCEYKADKTPWPRKPTDPLDDNKKNVFQPYRTHPDNALIYVAGLWADPALAWRLHREPPEEKPGKRFVRFVVNCKMKFVGNIEEAKYRWSKSQTLDTAGTAPAAIVQSCDLKEL